nr:C715 [uncultured bacterium]
MNCYLFQQAYPCIAEKAAELGFDGQFADQMGRFYFRHRRIPVLSGR